MKRTDSKGRVWEYCEWDGSWSHGRHTVGCGRNNERKWMVWDGPSKGYHEFATLKMAMESCK